MNGYHYKDREGQLHVIQNDQYEPFGPSSVTISDRLALRSPYRLSRQSFELPPPNFRDSVEVHTFETKDSRFKVQDKVALPTETKEKTKKKKKACDNEAANHFAKGMGTHDEGGFSSDEEDDAASLLEWESNDVDEDDTGQNYVARFVILLQRWFNLVYGWLNKITRGYFVHFILLIGYLVYFVAAMVHEGLDCEPSSRLLWCTLVGVVIVLRNVIRRGLTAIVWKCYGAKEVKPQHENRMYKARFFIRWFLYGALVAGMVYAFIREGIDEPKHLRALPGLVIFLIIPLLLSECPGKINWHTVFWGVGLQFLLSVGVLKWSVGRDSIVWAQGRVQDFFDNADAGSTFLFGDDYRDHYIIFGAIPIMFFANAALTVLYYLGVMSFLIKIIGVFLKLWLDTSPVESTCVATGVFLEGVTTLMLLKPYLPSLTKSELFAVIVSTYSTLGGAYLAILSAIGISLEYLIPSMIVSAPATFAVAKLMIPETKTVENTSEVIKKIDKQERTRYVNAMDAAQTGALTMLNVVGSICVVLFAFYSFISWLNHTLDWFGDRIGKDDLSVEYISSYMLYPVALGMGVDPDDCRRVGFLLGYRTWIHNFFAFLELGKIKRNGVRYAAYMVATNYTGHVYEDDDSMDMILTQWNETLPYGVISNRSEAIITYCMCGFSSFLNVAVVTGIMFSLVPKRKKWIAGVAMRGLLAGNLANCMTGCFAGIFYTED